jgi:AcrR family transcriptional regulator
MARPDPDALMREPPHEIAEALYAHGSALTAADPFRLEDLAREAGVPRATLYYYFAGREALLDWLTLQGLVREVAPLSGANISIACAELAETLARHPALTVRLMSALSSNTASDAVLLEADSRITAPLRAALKAAQMAGDLAPRARDSEVALGILGALSTLVVVRFHAGEIAGLGAVLRRLANQLLDGLRASGQSVR